MTEQAQRELGKTLGNIADKLAALKTHKKGLMQQLFPDLQEAVPPLPEAGRGEKRHGEDRGSRLIVKTPNVR